MTLQPDTFQSKKYIQNANGADESLRHFCKSNRILLIQLVLAASSNIAIIFSTGVGA